MLPMNILGFFLLAACKLSHSIIFPMNGSLGILAFSGQTFAQAQHRIHVSALVLAGSLAGIEPVGHADAHVPHLVHRPILRNGRSLGMYDMLSERGGSPAISAHHREICRPVTLERCLRRRLGL
jgi:hypothetical protein